MLCNTEEHQVLQLDEMHSLFLQREKEVHANNEESKIPRFK